MQSPDPKRPTVYVTCSQSDRTIARHVSNELSAAGYEVTIDLFDLLIKSSWRDTQLLESIRTHDVCILIISPDSAVTDAAVDDLIAALDRRDIDVIPVTIDGAEVPPRLIGRDPVSYAFNSGDLRELGERISRGSDSFGLSRLEPARLENMVGELLRRHGFEISTKLSTSTYQFDFSGYYQDPFSFGPRVPVVVEVKSTRTGRVPIRELSRLTAWAESIDPETQVLFVTNGQLTSPARDALSEFSRVDKLTIIDGPSLRKLLLGHEDLIRKYGPTGRGAV